jgi:hypothetical protein
MRGFVETRGRGTYGDGGNFHNRQGGRDEAEEEEEEEDVETCPLCCNDMDATDLAFKPCKCGYQLCAWCWHQIMEVGFGETVGKCPACRQDYDQDLLEFDAEQVASLTDASSAQQRRERGGGGGGGGGGNYSSSSSSLSSLQQHHHHHQHGSRSYRYQNYPHGRYSENYDGTSGEGDNSIVFGAGRGRGRGQGGRRGGVLFGGGGRGRGRGRGGGDFDGNFGGNGYSSYDPNAPIDSSRKHLVNVRVIQRNLVYVVGIPTAMCKEEILKKAEYFGKYGSIIKLQVSCPPAPASGSGNDVSNAGNLAGCAYVTFETEADAETCIQCIDGVPANPDGTGRPLRACHGTTKYCNAFLRNFPCGNPECLYLHVVGEKEDSFTKEEMLASYREKKKKAMFKGGSSNFKSNRSKDSVSAVNTANKNRLENLRLNNHQRKNSKRFNSNIEVDEDNDNNKNAGDADDVDGGGRDRHSNHHNVSNARQNKTKLGDRDNGKAMGNRKNLPGGREKGSSLRDIPAPRKIVLPPKKGDPA